MAKRYTEDDLPIVEKRDCIVCGRHARGGIEKLVSNGWLTTTKGPFALPVLTMMGTGVTRSFYRKREKR